MKTWADAVNCAFAGRATKGEHLTPKGVRILAEAILNVDTMLTAEQRKSITFSSDPFFAEAVGSDEQEP